MNKTWLDQGVVIALDLDDFGRCAEHMGWSEYTPNIITGFITEAVEELVSKHFGVVIWGLDRKRGTEEALLVFQLDYEMIAEELQELVTKVKSMAEGIDAPTSLSIGVAIGPLMRLKPETNNRKKTLAKDPTRVLAYKALREAKKRGGNTIVRY